MSDEKFPDGVGVGFPSGTYKPEGDYNREALRDRIEKVAGPWILTCGVTLDQKNKAAAGIANGVMPVVDELRAEINKLVAASLEHDYTVDHDGGTECVNEAEDRAAALANIVEMHRLLSVRAERLFETGEKLTKVSGELATAREERRVFWDLLKKSVRYHYAAAGVILEASHRDWKMLHDVIEAKDAFINQLTESADVTSGSGVSSPEPTPAQTLLGVAIPDHVETSAGRGGFTASCNHEACGVSKFFPHTDGSFAWRQFVQDHAHGWIATVPAVPLPEEAPKNASSAAN